MITNILHSSHLKVLKKFSLYIIFSFENKIILVTKSKSLKWLSVEKNIYTLSIWNVTSWLESYHDEILCQCIILSLFVLFN